MDIPIANLKLQFEEGELAIRKRIDDVLMHGNYILGPEVFELEDRLAKYALTKNCITVSSGTDALLISLMALGIGPGDEVITSPFTFAATVEVIVLVGATPIFADIELETCNIDAKLIERKITSKTKAIIPVSLYGQPADMNDINKLAKRYSGITVIEDGAQSFGANYADLKSCGASDIGCTSFFPSKPLGCYGDGGAIFTNSEDISRICREIRAHGQNQRYNHVRLGVAGRMDTLQCAILLAKFDMFDKELVLRQKVAKRYDSFFDSIGIKRIKVRDDRSSTYAQYTIFVQDRKKFQLQMHALGISTAVHYPIPLYRQPAYYQDEGNSKAQSINEFTSTEFAAKHVVSLPMGPYLSENVQDKVIEGVGSYIDLMIV